MVRLPRIGAESWTAAATIVIAFATLVTVGVAYYQWGAIREQSRDFRTQTAVSERAWVGPVLRKISASPGSSSITVFLPIENFGKSPALSMQPWAQYGWAPGAGEEPGQLPARHAVTLMPGDEISDPLAIPVAVAQQISATHPLYIYGIVDYSDIFGHRHRVTFCAMATQPDVGGLNGCSTHNDADDDEE